MVKEKHLYPYIIQFIKFLLATCNLLVDLELNNIKYLVECAKQLFLDILKIIYSMLPSFTQRKQHVGVYYAPQEQCVNKWCIIRYSSTFAIDIIPAVLFYYINAYD